VFLGVAVEGVGAALLVRVDRLSHSLASTGFNCAFDPKPIL
jgi:hypothetical protein